MAIEAAGNPQKIGFIGLGRMGRPMALRLVAAGHRLACHDVSPMATAPLCEAGAIVCQTAAEVAQSSGIVITMLPDGQTVREVLIGKSAVAAAMPRGAMVIDMSSSAPLGTRALGNELQALGLSMIDAPVSGGVARAADGALAIMAGGEAQDIARARPVLEAMGSRVFHTGALGSGHAVKALNNYVSAAGLTAACEAAIVAQAFGIDTATLVDVLNASTGRNNTTEVKMKPQILSGAFSSGFAMALMAKDVATAADLAQALGCGTSGTASQARLWAEALAMLGHHADHTEMYRFLQATGEQAERLGAAGSKSGGEHGKIGEDRSGADGADRPR